MMRFSVWSAVIGIAACMVCAHGCATPYSDQPQYRPGPERVDADVDEQGAERGAESNAESVPSPALSEKGWPLEPRKVLALEDCVRIAIARNRGVGLANRRILISEDIAGETLAIALPKLTARGNYNVRNNDPGVIRGGQSFVFGDKQTATGQLSLLVPLYSFGRASNRYEAAKLGIEVARQQAVQTEHDLRFAVSRAYFRILEAQKIQQVVEESIEVVKRQLETAREFLAQGLVARSDVLTAEVQLSERQQELIRAKNNVQLSIATLNRLLGLDVNRETEIVDVLEIEPWSGSFEAVLQTALDHRPDLAAARARVEASKAQYRATRADLFPVLFAQGDYNVSSDETLLHQQWLSGGGGVEWPLFEGGLTHHQMNRRRREIAESIDLHDEMSDDIVLDAKQAYLNVQETGERVPVAAKTVALAEENLRVMRDQYAQGLVSGTDVLIEEDRLSRTRSGYFQSLYDYHEAYAALVRVMGGSPPKISTHEESYE